MTVNSADDPESENESVAAHNREVERALKEYCSFPHPQDFAVMLSGPWGSGKTHFIRSIASNLVPRERRSSNSRPLYISLYGVKDVAEIADQLFQQAHPVLGHKATRFVAAFIQGALKATVKFDAALALEATGTIPSVNLSDIINNAKGRVIIFDDFERASLCPREILGYINPFVEHDGCKVIIVADEQNISKDDDYRKRKEKTIGNTLEYRSDLNSGFSSFLDLIGDDWTKSFLRRSRAHIGAIFADSELSNLRILKHILWDVERISKILTEDQKQHEQAMRELFSIFIASSIELRSGKVAPEEFRLLDASYQMAKYVSKKKDNAPSAVDLMFKRYTTVDFGSTTLSAKIIVDVVTKSKLPTHMIQTQLRQHPYFEDRKKLPSWRALWQIRNAPISEHDEIVRRFSEDFAALAIFGEAEINHVIGLSLWLADLPLPEWESENMTSRLQNYIISIYAKHEPTEHNAAEPVSEFHGSAFGLGFFNSNDDRFIYLLKFHNDHRILWSRRAYPLVAGRLRRLISSDSETFLRDVCFTPGGTAKFARSPVLKHIAAEEFASTLVSAQPNDQSNVVTALAQRYQHLNADSELLSELPWLNDVWSHISRLGSELPPIARYYFLSLVRRQLEPVLTDLKLRFPQQGDDTLPPPVKDFNEQT
jgi:hypothetical protein